MAEALEGIYRRLNRRGLVHPDPLEFLYNYDDPLDREIAGLVASSLALGRVGQILRSVSLVLDRTGPPRSFLLRTRPGAIESAFRDFRHRFISGEGLSSMLIAAKRILGKHGSLGMFFLSGFEAAHENALPALAAFAAGIRGESGGRAGSLVPDPEAGSAMKRLCLFLRWMVRRDEVDPGGWDGVPPSKLVVPLDVHMHRIGRILGFTRRSAADARTACEITRGFAAVAPDDPVKYDFSLTRLGIRDDCGDLMDMLCAIPGRC